MSDLKTLFKALSDGNRLKVISALLIQQELCACQISELMEVTGATASRHMSILISSGLVESRKEGRWVYYSLPQNDPSLISLLNWIEKELRKSAAWDRDISLLGKVLSSTPRAGCQNA